MAQHNNPFGEKAFSFLSELAANNERAWFEANKAQYETHVREPAREFIRVMAETIHAISPHLVASDAKVGGSLMRVHRDTRFSKDKTPYKTNVGIQFRHEMGKDAHAPGLYVHIAAGECFLGAGMWHPDPPTLARVRDAIVEKHDVWARTCTDESFRRHWEPGGESLKRPPRGYDPGHVHAQDLARKDHIAVHSLARADVLSPGFVETVAQRFAESRGYMEFLTRAIGFPF